MDYILPLEYLSFDPRTIYDIFNALKRDGYNPRWEKPGDPAGHEGIDLYNVLNFPILCAKSGWTTASGFLNPGAGYGVEIYSPDVVSLDYHQLAGSDGEGHRYLHMPSDNLVPQIGQWVEQGEVIGRIGLSGMTRSPHLHFEIRVIKGYKPYQTIIKQGLSAPPLSYGIMDKEEEQLPQPDAVSVYWPTLLKGDGYKLKPAYREYVQRMQYMLALGGYIDTSKTNFPNMIPDGMFGPSTREALIAFQIDNNLPADGVCDMDDWIILMGAVV